MEGINDMIYDQGDMIIEEKRCKIIEEHYGGVALWNNNSEIEK
jgi:hypothetical protein